MSRPVPDQRWLGGAEGAGLDLGIASARSLVSAWGGQFGIEQTPGGGATVSRPRLEAEGLWTPNAATASPMFSRS